MLFLCPPYSDATFSCAFHAAGGGGKRSARSRVMIGSVSGEDGAHPGQRWRTSRAVAGSAFLFVCFMLNCQSFTVFSFSFFSSAPVIAVDGRFAAVKNKLKLCPALAVKDKCHIFAVYY